jgi:hypothetical protein
MGSSQSIPSTSEITDAPLTFSKKEEYTASTKNGPKTTPIETTLISGTADDDVVILVVKDDEEQTNNNSINDCASSNSSVSSSESNDDYSLDEDKAFDFDSNEEEKEADEFIAERRMILDDARKLSEIAGHYYHPEEPVLVSDPTACARCFFSRYSAETTGSDNDDEAEQRMLIVADAANLKKLAEDYLHPEKPVVTTDANAFGRNYFTRASAPDTTEEEEEEEERERIMEDMKQLKTTAAWYLQPEKPVDVDSAACGRNYFSRVSAPNEEDTEERERVLEEAAELKKMADWYMHPEKPVASDSTVCGRNYFTRSSASEYDDEDMKEERERIMEDMKQLKTTAGWFLQPEKPVAVDSTACGRNYFSRPAAFDDDEGCLSWSIPSSGLQLSIDFQSNCTDEMEEERNRVFAEAAELKKTCGGLPPSRKTGCFYRLYRLRTQLLYSSISSRV